MNADDVLLLSQFMRFCTPLEPPDRLPFCFCAPSEQCDWSFFRYFCIFSRINQGVREARKNLLIFIYFFSVGNIGESFRWGEVLPRRWISSVCSKSSATKSYSRKHDSHTHSSNWTMHRRNRDYNSTPFFRIKPDCCTRGSQRPRLDKWKGAVFSSPFCFWRYRPKPWPGFQKSTRNSP